MLSKVFSVIMLLSFITAIFTGNIQRMSSELIASFEIENASRIARILSMQNTYPDPCLAASQISGSLDKQKRDIEIKNLAKSQDLQKVKEMISARNRKED